MLGEGFLARSGFVQQGAATENLLANAPKSPQNAALCVRESMKLLLNNSEGIEFSCKDDLAKVIPFGIQGKPLNYGQGEGQVEIDGTVWGFYVNTDNSYYMAFEEGVVEWAKIENLVHGITDALTQQFGKKITVITEGSLTNDPNV